MCHVCKYNQVKDIDRALLAGTTPASLSKQYKNFSTSMLERHQEHLGKKIALAQERFHNSLHQGLFCKLNTVMEMVLQVIRKTRTAEDPKVFLQAGREFTRIVTLMDKMAAKIQFDPEFVYCLMGNMQWNLQEDALVPYAFQALSLTRQNMKLNLFAPCPEPDPESEPMPASDSSPAIHPSQRETLPAGSDPEPLLGMSRNLVRLPEPEKMPSAKHARN